METQTTNVKFIPYQPTQPAPQAVTPIEETKQVEDLGHHKLLSCLYFLFDAFERCGLEFFLVRDTAKKAKTSYMLEGDHIDIDVRLNEWNNDQKDILFSHFINEHVEEISKLPTELTFKYDGVIFTIHLYENNPHVMALIPITYEYETWKIPNQFEEFEKDYDK